MNEQPHHASKLLFWDRGGTPGRSYQQNKLSATAGESGVAAEFLKVRWDPADPPYRTDVYTLALRAEEFAALCGRFDELLAGTFEEEVDPRIGGVTRITVQVSVGDIERAKVFYQRLPTSHAGLRAQLDGLMARCEAAGSHRVLPRPAPSGG